MVSGLALAGLLVGGLAACGDDDDGGAVASDATTTTEATATTEATESTDDGPLAEPVVKGKGAEQPPYPALDDAPEGAELEEAVGEPVDEPADVMGESPVGRSILVQERTGADYSPPQNAGFKGMTTIFEYDNHSPGVDTSRSCGQAAMATLLAAWGKVPMDPAGGPVTDMWNSYGPNIAFGAAGTNWDQLDRAFKDYGMNVYISNRGFNDLKAEIAGGYPVAVMVDVGAVSNVWGGHWIVAYAYDNNGIYVTNWNFNGSPYIGYLKNADFKKAWNGNLPRAAGFAGWFIEPYL